MISNGKQRHIRLIDLIIFIVLYWLFVVIVFGYYFYW
jgi:hypothetical protein